MLVIDASIALAWLLPDEQSEFADTVLEQVSRDGALAPSIWALEVGNALLMAERRKRLTSAQIAAGLTLIRQLRIRLSGSAMETDFGHVFALAHKHKLTSYDASYLELAVRSSFPLASLDGELTKVAKNLGVFFPGT